MLNTIEQPGKSYFEVGAVSKITGLSPHTIRTWERRGFIKAANRSESGRRRYSQDQVEQLALMKKLTDQGDAISALSQLDLEELRKRLLEYHSGQTAATHETRGELYILTEGKQAKDWLASLSSRFKYSPSEEGRYDLVVIAMDANAVETRRRVSLARHEHPDTPIALIYDFAPRELIKQFSDAGYFLIRWPTPKEVLEHYIVAAIANASHQTEPIGMEDGTVTGSAPQRVFSDRQLTLIASTNPNIKCECPHHISALVASLASFENYCRRCEIESPADAEVHAHLGYEIGKARSLVENALLYLCEKDNLEIPKEEA